MDDDELIARVAGGDDAALRELFRRHAPWLAARLRAVLPAADVEDVLQETFLGGLAGCRGYRPRARRGGWLWGSPGGRPPCTCAAAGRPAAAARLIDADGRHAGDPAEAALSRAEIAAAVAALGPAGSPDRDVWQLLYVEDRPVAEVAS